MTDGVFLKIIEEIAGKYGQSVEKIEQYFDKQIITHNKNKDGEYLYMLRKLTFKEVTSSVNSCRGRYSIYTQDGQFVGYINLVVSNNLEADEAEIIAEAAKEHRNKGNIPACLEEVLKDVFVDRSYDGFQIRNNFPKTKMKRIFLAIAKENIASQKSAIKSGFVKTKDDGIGALTYEMTEEAFLKRMEEKNASMER